MKQFTIEDIKRAIDLSRDLSRNRHDHGYDEFSHSKDEIVEIMCNKVLNTLKLKNSPIKSYVLYHPIEGINHELEPSVHYKKIWEFEADSLENAFDICQNLNEEYKKLGVRNTTVGDVFYETFYDEQQTVFVGDFDFKRFPDFATRALTYMFKD